MALLCVWFESPTDEYYRLINIIKILYLESLGDHYFWLQMKTEFKEILDFLMTEKRYQFLFSVEEIFTSISTLHG